MTYQKCRDVTGNSMSMTSTDSEVFLKSDLRMKLFILFICKTSSEKKDNIFHIKVVNLEES